MDIKDYGTRLTTLGTRYLAEGARAWEGYTKAVAEALSGSGRGEDIQKNFTHVALRDGPELARNLAQCNIDYYKGVMDTGFSFGTQFFETIVKKTAESESITTKRKRKTKK